MEQAQSRFDLEDRSLEFAKRVRGFVERLPKTSANYEDGKQLIRSSGSIGANYIEANEALSRKDFVLRLKISRKEAKENRYWLKLISTGSDTMLDSERNTLIQEAGELMLIMNSIIRKFEQ